MELSERLSLLMSEKGITAYELSAKTEIQQSTISRILSGKTQKLSMKNRDVLASYFNVNSDWMSSELGGKYKSIVSEALPIYGVPYMMVPFIPVAARTGYLRGFGHLVILI